MKATSIFLASLLFFAFSSSASAEFYRYVDQHGNVLYTDDVNQIPADQRDKVTAYEESYGEPEPEAPDETPGQAKASGNKAAMNAMEEERQALEAQKKELDKEFEDLKARRTQLDEAKANAVTPEQIKAYNQEIIDFNTRAKAHQEKLDAYTAEVNSYNKRLQDEMDKDKPEKQEEE